MWIARSSQQSLGVRDECGSARLGVARHRRLRCRCVRVPRSKSAARLCIRRAGRCRTWGRRWVVRSPSESSGAALADCRYVFPQSDRATERPQDHAAKLARSLPQIASPEIPACGRSIEMPVAEAALVPITAAAVHSELAVRRREASRFRTRRVRACCVADK